MRAYGPTTEADDKLQHHSADFRAVDPTVKKLDLSDRNIVKQQNQDCRGKWLWILTGLKNR